MFPQTELGRVALCFYALLTVPLYVAVKAEIGNLICRFILWLAQTANTVHKKRNNEQSTREAVPQPSDHLLMVVIVLTFAVLVLVSSGLVLVTERWSFLKSFYFVFSTVSLVGLGDVVPSQHVLFLCQTPIFLIGDILLNNVNFFFLSRYRTLASHLARLTTSIVEAASTEPISDNDVTVEFYPEITTNALPTGILACERTQKDITTHSQARTRSNSAMSKDASVARQALSCVPLKSAKTQKSFLRHEDKEKDDDGGDDEEAIRLLQHDMLRDASEISRETAKDITKVQSPEKQRRTSPIFLGYVRKEHETLPPTSPTQTDVSSKLK